MTAEAVTRYELRDADARLVAVHHRQDRDGAKSMWWTRPDGTLGLGGMPTADLPLFSTHLLASRPGERVILVEGAKTAQFIQNAGLLALGTVTGAGGTPSLDVLRPLVGREVILWPDADPPGREHMTRIAGLLRQLGIEPRVVAWPAAPPGGDAADFIDVHGEGLELARILDDARPVEVTPAAADAGVVLVRLADVAPRPVRWLWRGWVPLGKVAVIDSDPGLGKSLFTVDLGARVTRAAPMPDGTRGDLPGPCGVVYLTAEDDLEDTLRPRLDLASADVTRVVALSRVTGKGGERFPTIADLHALGVAIRAVEAALVVIDPLMAYLPDARDSHRDQDIRRALAPLAALAAQTGVAVLVVRHLNKSGGGNPLYRGGGSIGIIGAARSGLLVARDPDDPDGVRRILAVTKANLAPEPPALAYHIEAVQGVARIVWEGTTPHTASSLLAAQVPEAERSALEAAEQFLHEILTDGPIPAKQVQAEAREAGVAERTLWRAKGKLSVVARKDSFTGGWRWESPAPKAAKKVQVCHPPRVADLAVLGPGWQPSELKVPVEGTVEGPPGITCPACRGALYWQSVYGTTVCAACHPPADFTRVARWLARSRGRWLSLEPRRRWRVASPPEQVRRAVQQALARMCSRLHVTDREGTV